MQITIDTNNLSELDKAMLVFLATSTDEPEQAEGPVQSIWTEKMPEEPVEAPKPKKAPKAAPAPAPVAPVVEVVEELIEVEVDGPTMSDAVAAATNLVSSGQAPVVKAALAAVGAKRVSEMAVSDIPAFLAALEV